MKKVYLLLFTLLTFAGYQAFGQCQNGTAFGSATINPAGTVSTISSCSFAGEYSTLNGAVNGQTLRVTSSVATDFVTIRSGSFNGPVIASGVTPLVFNNTFTGTLFAHWNTSAACGTQNTCRTTTVQCTSCSVAAPPNDLCSGAITINCGQTINASTVGASTDAVPTCNTTLNTAPGVWYTFVGDGSLVTLSLCGSAYDTKIGVFTGTCGSFTCVVGNDDFCGLQSQVTFPSVNGTTYYVLVTGFSSATGNFTLTRTCVAQCSGVPSPGIITGPSATVCSGASVTLNLSGQTTQPGITYQWRSAATPGGPYTAIAGATGSSYTFTTSTTAYFICTVTCSISGLSANTVEFAVNVSRPAHSNVATNITTNCAPGAFTVSATASGGSGNYTHQLTGPGGTIGAPVVSGPNNSNVSFTVTNVPAGTHVFTLRSTDALGCFVNTPVNVVINPTPTITVTPPTATICNGAIQTITATAGGIPGSNQTFSNTGNIVIPGAGTGASTGAPANPYPSAINVTGLPASGVSVASVSLNGFSHTFPDDVDVVLVSPTGQAVILMSDCGGSTAVTGRNYILSDGAASLLSDGTNNPSGTYRPTNYGFTPSDAFPAPGPGTLTQPIGPTLATFTGNMNGTWGLFVVDDLGGDAGSMSGGWSITFTTPPPAVPVTFSPLTSLFTDPAATVPYTGTPVTTVYARPSSSITYTATATFGGCSASATSVITVNQLPAITAQPTALAAPVCPGFNVNYSVSATGTGLTYQWQISTDNGTSWNNITDGPQYSGTTTAALTIINVPTSLNNARYRCIVSGTCTPSVTSSSVTLVVSTAPTITTQPANATVCEGLNTSFSVVAAGVPAPTLFQWQVSTNAGVTWTNLPVFGPTLSITNAAVSQNGNRYRVIVTNSCGQSVTSNGAATLTVNARPAVSINPLPSRICISDTLVPLTGIPTGGFFTGVGVSGFNFVPPATAIGTYTLTYSFTNTAGCNNTATVVARVQECAERVRLLRDDAVVLFPNPNSGRFNIRINSVLYNYLGMNVYNTSGQLVKQQTWGGLVFGRVLPIDLTFLPGGVYMVKFFYDDGVRTSEKTFPVVIGRNN